MYNKLVFIKLVCIIIKNKKNEILLSSTQACIQINMNRENDIMSETTEIYCKYCKDMETMCEDSIKNCDPKPTLVNGKWACFWCMEEQSEEKKIMAESVEFIMKEDMINKLLIKTINTKLKKLKCEPINSLANTLHIEVEKIKSNGKTAKKNKSELLPEIENKLKILSNQELIKTMKNTRIGMELEVKNILDNNIDIDDLTNLNICLTLETFFEKNPNIKPLFDTTCDLVNVKDAIKSVNCMLLKVQGLYILTISKNNIDYIVKLGSFAESQGMFSRICSFGGGNYETGSLTNKWFQRFIKKAIEQGYTSKFTYYNRVQETILIDNLDGDKIEMTPYVMRPLESDLFKKYNTSNYNIPPIFGSNCL